MIAQPINVFSSTDSGLPENRRHRGLGSSFRHNKEGLFALGCGVWGSSLGGRLYIFVKFYKR